MSEKNNLKRDLKELEAIVDWFEAPDIDLNEAIVKFSEGQKKADQIKHQLAELENKITVLAERFDQAG